MTAKMIDIKTGDGVCDSYVAYPDNRKNLPVILFYMDAIGLRPQIFEMVQVIAEHGYFVIAPNIFYRSKKSPIADYEKLLNPAGLPELLSQVLAMARDLTPEKSKSDADALLKYAESHDADVKNVGAVGYCMGGGIAMRMAAFFPDQIKAVASYHAGRLATDDAASPHLFADRIKAKLYVAHADNDKSMPPDMIERFEAAMKRAGVEMNSELYAGASHGFTMKDLPAYDASAEARHWKTFFELMKPTL
jgi:carboxymethylenebutenolidase